MLYCVECGRCSGELGHGWVAFRCDDQDETEPPALALYCPPCAAAEFGYRPDASAKYVCAWEALPSVPETDWLTALRPPRPPQHRLPRQPRYSASSPGREKQIGHPPALECGMLTAGGER